MGFDLYVMVNLMLDVNSGLPIVYKGDKTDAFDSVEYQVPAEYRRFVQQRGNWFSNYILQFEGNHVSSEYFLEHYPEWEDAMEGCEDDLWTRDDHDDFRKALEWFSHKGNFIVTWSY